MNLSEKEQIIDYKRKLSVICDNLIKTRPAEQVVYRPYKKPHFAQRTLRKGIKIDLGQYYRNALNGDYAYVYVNIKSQYTTKVMLTAKGASSYIINNHENDFKDENKNKMKSKVGRDILFIERNLDFVRPGGRLAIVLPQGRFNNTSDKDIREYIAKKARILAVVGLDVNTFKPHTGTKTSVIFLQKWNDDNSDKRYYCPQVEDYPIFFAVSEKSGKDNSGEYVYAKDENGRLKLDKHGHYIVDHDLHNHEKDLPDGIAEAFIDFAKSEKLSFWGEE